MPRATKNNETIECTSFLWAVKDINRIDKSKVIKDWTFEGYDFADTTVWARFENCEFKNCNFIGSNFELAEMVHCNFDVYCTGDFPRPYPENAPSIFQCFEKEHLTSEQYKERLNHIKETLGADLVVGLPNKEYAKATCTCSFCHSSESRIVKLNEPQPWMRQVPNSDKRVCEFCWNNYQLYDKEFGNRTYGWHGALSYKRTPMDKKYPTFLGLEMEFEGDFYGWQELQLAHHNLAHYGMDSSVDGQNELSWDCGTYSWWKYLSPLKEVCDAIKNNGGKAGDTAGIHIHCSNQKIDSETVARTLMHYAQDNLWKTLFRAVSLRNSRERMDRYACFETSETSHHSAISYNSHGTCEFRIFNSSVNPKTILKQMKFCKELFELVMNNTPKKSIMQSFSETIKNFIAECANIQAGKGFITESEKDELITAVKGAK